MDILIVGGGIGGFAVAAALRGRGHRITVLEQSPGPAEVGAAVGLAPNATAALAELGAGAELADRAVAPRAWTRRRWQNGAVIGSLTLGDTVHDEFGFPFWMSHRVHLLRALRDRATAAGPDDVRVVHGARVVAADDASGTVRTHDGRAFGGDLVVGADGIRSVVRAAVADAGQALYSGNIAVRAQIETARIVAAPRLAAFVTDNRLETWMGPGGHIVTSIIQAGRQLNITACFEAPPIGSDSWSAEEGVELLAELVRDWHPPLRELIGLAGSIGRWDLYDRDPIPRLVRNRVVLVGDAAHPMLPYLGQGAAQTLEDAVALGRCLDGAAGTDVALRRYESARLARTHLVQRRSRENRELLHLPDGPEQQARDAMLAAGGGDLELLRWLWSPTSSGLLQPAHTPTEST